jgi:hypothetical protein
MRWPRQTPGPSSFLQEGGKVAMDWTQVCLVRVNPQRLGIDAI